MKIIRRIIAELWRVFHRVNICYLIKKKIKLIAKRDQVKRFLSGWDLVLGFFPFVSWPAFYPSLVRISFLKRENYYYYHLFSSNCFIGLLENRRREL